MREPDTDFDFDFFEEPSTQETAVRERPFRGGPRRPVRPPSGLTPLLRLIGLIAFAIVAVVVLVFVVKGCRDENKEGEYERYLGDVTNVARESSSIGRDLNGVLTQPGIRQDELEQRLNGLAQRQEQLVATADDLDPPGRLVPEQQALVAALDLRVGGLRGLEDTFRRTTNSTDATAAGAALSAHAQRFVASDVIWDDLFRGPSLQELRRAGVTGVRVPNSDFLSNPDLATSTAMKAIWQRVHGAKTDGAPTGLHGSALVSTEALPSGQELSQDTETTIEATTDLAFAVTVENSGDNQEVGVEVTLTIQKSPRPLVKTQQIDVINPGEDKTLTFSDLGQPPFGTPTSVKVDVKPVPGETRTGNNTAEYPVFFSFS
jgi:hypothetical protein